MRIRLFDLNQNPKSSFRGLRLIFLLFFCGVFLTQILFGAARRDIKGFVRDQYSGEALPYANVTLKGTRIGTITNTQGYFVLVNPPANADTLEVFYIGYKPLKILLKEQDISKPLKINLKQQVLEFDAVTVTAEQYEIWKKADEVSQVTVSPLRTSALPNLGEIDIFRSLQLLPGISGVGDGSSGLYVRGGTPDQNLVLLDGMKVYHVDHFFGFFSAFNANAIKDVQIYKGGFPAKYGGRLSSVLELTGKDGYTRKKSFGVGLNLLSSNAVLELPLFSGKGSWIISGRRSYTDIIQSSLYNKLFDFITEGDATTTGPQGGMGRMGGRGFQQEEIRPDFYFYDLNSKLSFAPTFNDKFALSFYSGKDNMHDVQEIGGMRFARLDSLDVSDEGSRARDELTSWGNLGTSFKWAHRWTDRFSSDILFAGSQYFSKHTTDLSFESEALDSVQVFRGRGDFASNEDNNIDDLTFQIDNEWFPSQNHRIGLGLEFSQTNTEYIATINDTTETMNRSNESQQTTLYLQDKWQVSPLFELTAGIRSTYYSPTKSYYTEPRLSFQYTLTEKLRLKGAWGKYNQYIHRITNEDVLEGSRDFWLIADDDLEPGSATHYIAGLDYETPNYLFEIESYYKDLDNLLEFSRRLRERADLGGLFFFGSGVSRGIEFLAQKKSGAINGWLSYTLGEVEYNFPNLNNGESYPASHDRTHEVKCVGTYSRGRWNFSATWVFASGQPYTSPEGQYNLTMLDGTTQSYIHVGDKNATFLPDYHRMDISASYKLTDKSTSNWDSEIGVSVFNLYDHKNVWYRKYDLDVSPILISDVTMLGFTPTVYYKIRF